MEPTILIEGRYICPESIIFTDGYISLMNSCALHKLSRTILEKRQFDNSTIISFSVEIAKMRKIYPNFLLSYQQLVSKQKIILTNCIGTLLLKRTLLWLESGTDYKNSDYKLFKTDLEILCNDMCSFDYHKFSVMTNLIEKINLLITNCECKYILTISQKMRQGIPVYSRLDLVHATISKTILTDIKLDIDTIVYDAFETVNSEFYEPEIIEKKLSELPRNLRTKINETHLETNDFTTKLFIDDENNIIISFDSPMIHKSEMENTTLMEIDLEDSVCIICDSIIRQSKWMLRRGCDDSIILVSTQNRGKICNIFCDPLLTYVATKLNISYNYSHEEILTVKKIQSRLFLLYAIKIQMNFCSDILGHIGLFLLRIMIEL